jgi:hypothetical protein
MPGDRFLVLAFFIVFSRGPVGLGRAFVHLRG